MKNTHLIFVFAFSIFAFSVNAMPPPVPSAGIIERELEKEYEGQPLEPDKPIPNIQIDIPEERLHIPSGRKVHINNIEIKGNTAIPTRELMRQIKEYQDRDLSLQDIYELCHVIDQYYAKKGYFLARAYPPPQAIEKGVLTEIAVKPLNLFMGI